MASQDAGIFPRVHSVRTPVAAFLLTIWFAMLLCGVACQPAHAHAMLTGTVPADGAILDRPPEALVLSFNEPASPISAALVRPGGEIVDLDQLTSSAAIISVGLPGGLEDGSYAVSWRAVSEDGHPISGTTFFAIGAASGSAVAGVPDDASLVQTALWGARILLFVSLFFGVGGAAFRLIEAELPPLATSTSLWLIVAGLIAAPAIIGLQGLDLQGSDLTGIIGGKAWQAGLTSPYGTTALLALCALILGILALRAKDHYVARAVGLLAMGVTGVAVIASGHASAASPQWLTKTALFVHITTIAWWVGGLFPLVLLLRQDRHTASPPLIRFSRAIPFAIVPLVVSGAVLAVVQLGPFSPFWWSSYGQVLAAKLALLVILFAIASWNRWVLTGPAAAGDARALSHMRRGIVAEIVIILAVLALASTWRFTPPPRAYVAEAASPISVQLANGRLQAVVTFAPARVGSMDFEIAIQARDGEPLSPKSVKLSLEPGNGEIAQIVREANPVEGGLWRVDQLTVPFAGAWSAEVEVRVSDFELVKLTGTVEIAP